MVDMDASAEPVKWTADGNGMIPVLVASTIGTAIEWYDFFLYNTMAAIVFPHLFFPKQDALVGTLLSYSTFLVGFLARPIGGAIFGHMGDRVGRKSTLVATLLLMGLSTLAMGFMPGYKAIGVAAPILVSALRFCQGLGVGGEWGGSVLLALEHGSRRNRGLWASFPQAGVPIGLLLSSLAVAGFASLSGPHFAEWGWRIPFFLSAALVILGLVIRIHLHETPLFAKVLAEKRQAPAPLVMVIRTQWREILLTAGARFVEQAPFYLFTAFVLTYGKQRLHLHQGLLLLGVNIAAAIEIFTIPLTGYLSDRLGRRGWYLGGCAVMAAFAFPYFALLDSRRPWAVVAAIVLSLPFCHALVYGPQAALIAERFGTNLRYSGASLGYQLAAPFAGGLAPIIATEIMRRYPGTSAPIAGYLVLLSVISFISVWALKNGRGDGNDDSVG